MGYSDADRRMAKVYGVVPEGLAGAIERSQRQQDDRAAILAGQRAQIAKAAAKRAAAKQNR